MKKPFYNVIPFELNESELNLFNDLSFAIENQRKIFLFQNENSYFECNPIMLGIIKDEFKMSASSLVVRIIIENDTSQKLIEPITRDEIIGQYDKNYPLDRIFRVKISEDKFLNTFHDFENSVFFQLKSFSVSIHLNK